MLRELQVTRETPSETSRVMRSSRALGRANQTAEAFRVRRGRHVAPPPDARAKPGITTKQTRSSLAGATTARSPPLTRMTRLRLLLAPMLRSSNATPGGVGIRRGASRTASRVPKLTPAGPPPCAEFGVPHPTMMAAISVLARPAMGPRGNLDRGLSSATSWYPGIARSCGWACQPSNCRKRTAPAR